MEERNPIEDRRVNKPLLRERWELHGEELRAVCVCVASVYIHSVCVVGGWEMCVSVCVCAYFCTAVYHPAASVRLMTTSTGMRSATASLLALMVRRMPFPACVCL